MGANRFKAYPDVLKAALTKLTRRQQESHAIQGTKASGRFNVWSRLSDGALIRLAQHILNSNRHLRRFEVELGDELTCDAVCRELQESGCHVRRIPFKWVLEVTCPEDSVAQRAA